MCIWQASLLIHTCVRGHVAQECVSALYLPLCVCMRVSVFPHHSLLIRYGDVSCRPSWSNAEHVKPYRDQRKQSRKPSWQSVCVCGSTAAGWNAFWMLWPFTKPGLSAVLITLRKVWFFGLVLWSWSLDTRLCSLRCPWTSSQHGFPQHVVSKCLWMHKKETRESWHVYGWVRVDRRRWEGGGEGGAGYMHLCASAQTGRPDKKGRSKWMGVNAGVV